MARRPHHFYQLIVSLWWQGFRASHDPDIFTIWHADDGRLCFIIQIGDQVAGFKWPDKLHLPFGVGGRIVDRAHGVVNFQRAIKAAFVNLLSLIGLAIAC